MMKHKSGSLTNLELGLVNALAVEFLLYAKETGEVQVWGRGNRFLASRVTGRAGYEKTTSYHYRLLNRLVEYGYVIKTTVARTSYYGLGVSAFRWLNMPYEADLLAEELKAEAERQARYAIAQANELRRLFPDNTFQTEQESTGE